MKLFSNPIPIRLPLTFESPAEGIALVKENERDFDARLNAILIHLLVYLFLVSFYKIR